jgi:hypothetical protein
MMVISKWLFTLANIIVHKYSEGSKDDIDFEFIYIMVLMSFFPIINTF